MNCSYIRACIILQGVIGVSMIAAFIANSRSDGCVDRRETMDFAAIAASVKTYQIQCGSYPSSEQGFQALVTCPPDHPDPTKWRQVLNKIPLDAWTNPYCYRLLPCGDDFEIRSAGKDGIIGTKDDLSSIKD
jgi:general secretion pathway protein G